MADALDALIKRLQYDQDDHPPTQTWWPKKLRRQLRNVYEERQDALEILYKMRRQRDLNNADEVASDGR